LLIVMFKINIYMLDFLDKNLLIFLFGYFLIQKQREHLDFNK